jgi:tetratricopeptide (TPR) repeat protein
MYTPTDKRVIKTRRQISLTLLKGQKYREALDELHQMLDLEKKAFGESSIQVAKTLNLLGSVYLSLNEVTESQSYLKQAQKIFAENGQAKTANNIKTKLKYVKDVKENKRPALKLTSVREEP